MVKVAFSPSDMPPSTLRTPSSQPAIARLAWGSASRVEESVDTANDLADADLGLEVAAADGRVESAWTISMPANA